MDRAIDNETRLRKLIMRDAGELFALVDANREHLREWLPWVDACTSVADSRHFIFASISQDSHNRGFQCAITLRKRIVGVAGFHPIDWRARSVALGYWLDRGHCGRGIATRAVLALTQHAFNRLQLKRVELRIAPENRRSRALAERLQMSVMRRVERAELLCGRWVDHVVYATERPLAGCHHPTPAEAARAAPLPLS